MDPQSAPQMMADPVAWATTTVGAAALGDHRRTRRVVATAARVAADPGRSLPAAVR